jgi:hypothetical protein
MEIAGLKQEVVRLREAVKQLGEVAANDIQHLAQAQVQTAAAVNPWPWIVGLGLTGVVAYWLFGTDAQGDSPKGPTMGGGNGGGGGGWGGGPGPQGPSRPSGSPMGKIADRVVNKLVDRGIGKALGMVF